MLRKLGWTRWALLCAGVAVIAGSCKGATEITLQVTTNAACDASAQADRFSQLGISVGTPGKVQAQAPAGTSQACKTLVANLGPGYGPNDLGTLVLAPAHAKDEGVEVVAVAAILPVGGQSVDLRTCETWVDTGQPAAGFRNYSDPDDGRPLMPCLVARRSLSFASSTNLQLPIQLDVSCTGVVCSPGSTCVSKVCVPDTPPPMMCNEMNPDCSLSGGGGAMTTSAATTNASTVGTTTGSSTAAVMTGTTTVSSATMSNTSSSGITTATSTTNASSTGTSCNGQCSTCMPGNICNTSSCFCECDPVGCPAMPGCMCVAIATPGGAGSTCTCPGTSSGSTTATSSTGFPNTGSSSTGFPNTSSSSGIGPTSSSSSGGGSGSSSSGATACQINSGACGMCVSQACTTAQMSCLSNVNCTPERMNAYNCACSAQMMGNTSAAAMCMSNFGSMGSIENSLASCIVNSCGSPCGV